jgi:alpha-tubulin suppressor-like RCC1 family protein
MQIDISKLGYRWKGLYSAAESYSRGDVTRKDNKVKSYNGSSWVTMGSGQLNAENKNELLTPGTSLNLSGMAGQQIMVQSDGSLGFTHTEGRHGTTVYKLAKTGQWMDGKQRTSGLYTYPHANMGFVMTDGTVRMIGRGNEGQLGVGNTNDYSRHFPVNAGFPPGVKIKALYGMAHGGTFYAIDYDDQLWAWGNSNYGQIGNGSTGDVPIPTLINGMGELPADAKVVDVKPGQGNWWGYFCVSIRCNNGDVYSWGSNRYGALCHETGNTTQVNTPKLVPLSQRVNIVDMHITSSYYQTGWFITDEGVLYANGQNDAIGDILTGDPNLGVPQIWTPSLYDPVAYVTEEESDSHVSAGAQYYHAHGIVTRAGNFYRWGHKNIYSNLTFHVNYDSNLATWTPAKWTVDGMEGNVTEAYATSGHYATSMVRKKDGTIWGIGYDGFACALFGRGNQGTWTEITELGNDNAYLWHGGSRYGKMAYVIKNDGRQIMWGNCYNGIAGQGTSFGANNTKPIMLNKTVIERSFSGYANDSSSALMQYLLTDSGTVYAHGQNDYNKGGFDDDGEHIYVPTPVIF